MTELTFRAKLARARSQPSLFPAFLPLPDVGGRLEWHAISQLVGEHQDLSAMVGFVAEHISEHAGSSGPNRRPAAAREFRHSPFRTVRQGVGQHPKTLRGATLVRGRGLFHGAPVRID